MVFQFDANMMSDKQCLNVSMERRIKPLKSARLLEAIVLASNKLVRLSHGGIVYIRSCKSDLTTYCSVVDHSVLFQANRCQNSPLALDGLHCSAYILPFVLDYLLMRDMSSDIVPNSNAEGNGMPTCEKRVLFLFGWATEIEKLISNRRANKWRKSDEQIEIIEINGTIVPKNSLFWMRSFCSASQWLLRLSRIHYTYFNILPGAWLSYRLGYIPISASYSVLAARLWNTSPELRMLARWWGSQCHNVSRSSERCDWPSTRFFRRTCSFSIRFSVLS